MLLTFMLLVGVFLSLGIQAAAVPKILIVTPGVGDRGAEFPTTLAALWKPLSVSGKPIGQEVVLRRIDYTQQKLVEFPQPKAETNAITDFFVIQSESQKQIKYLDDIVETISNKNYKIPAEIATPKEQPTSEQYAWITTQIDNLKEKEGVPESGVLYLDPNGEPAQGKTVFTTQQDARRYIESQIESSNSDQQSEVNLTFLVIYKLSSKVNIPVSEQLPIRKAVSAGPAQMASQDASPIINPDLFGIIEIGSKGVKAAVIQLTNTEIVVEEDEDAIVSRVIRKKYTTLDKNAIHPDSIQEVADAVTQLWQNIKRDFDIDYRNIYIVGSSGIANISHKDRLTDAVRQKLDKEVAHYRAIDFISAEDEAKYAFEGVIRLLPNTDSRNRNLRELRRQQAILIDIGSGNTKGAYLEDGGITTFEIPWGTASFSNEVDKQRDARAFKDVSADLRTGLLVPKIRDATQRKVGLRNLGRVYLIGGIAWALTNLIHPEDTHKFPILSFHDIDTLHNRLIANDADLRVCRENAAIKINADIAQICKKFTIENLIAGTDILKALSQELHFETKDKIAFFKDSLYLWPIGYLEHKVKTQLNLKSRERQ